MFKRQMVLCALLISLGCTIRTQERKFVVKELHKTKQSRRKFGSIGARNKANNIEQRARHSQPSKVSCKKGLELIQLTKVRPPLAFNTTQFQRLINEGADFTVRETVLIAVINADLVEKDSVEAVRMLLNAGADVNDPGSTQYNFLQKTPLMHATQNSQLEIVKLLLATSKVDVNKRCKYSSTALFLLISINIYTFARAEAIARVLIAAGADINARCRDTPVSVANFFDTPHNGTTALWEVKEDRDWVRMLIEAGADVNLKYACSPDSNNMATIFDRAAPEMKIYIEQLVKERKEREERVCTLPEYELPEKGS